MLWAWGFLCMHLDLLVLDGGVRGEGSRQETGRWQSPPPTCCPLLPWSLEESKNYKSDPGLPDDSEAIFLR